MNKLARIIQGLGARELELIQKDLDAGNINALIQQRRQQLAATADKVCPVCGSPVEAHRHLVLEFGPADLRQRAVFDAPDCLRYFVEERIQQH